MSENNFVTEWQNNVAALKIFMTPRRRRTHVASVHRRVRREARRDVVEAGIEALKALWHRGAVDADGKTGDGAGIHIEIRRIFSGM